MYQDLSQQGLGDCGLLVPPPHTYKPAIAIACLPLSDLVPSDRIHICSWSSNILPDKAGKMI